MSGRYGFERQVGAWLASERPTAPPEDLLQQTLGKLAVTPRRRGWQILDRWTWRSTAGIRTLARAAALTAVVAAIAGLAIWLAILAGSRRPAPPFGLTRAGLIAFDSADGIVVQMADTTERRVLVPPDGQSISPTWSRDGLRLAYWHRPGASGPWSLLVVDADGRNSSVVADGVTLRERERDLNQPSNISWSPDGRHVAFAGDATGGTGIYVATIGRSRATLMTDPALEALDPAWSPDGRLIAFQSSATESLHVVAPDGTGEHQLGTLTGTFLWPDWKPDGSAIATMAFVPDPENPDEGQTEIFTVSVSGTVVANISRDPADDFSPAWSPDGAQLAWDRIPEGESARAFLVVTRPDGPNVVEIRVDADLAPPAWAPDGTRLFSYVQDANGAFHEIVVIDPSGVAPVVRLPAEGNVGNGNWQRLP